MTQEPGRVNFQKLVGRAAATLGAVALAVSWAAADAPPGPYFNGFETNTAGWFNFVGATVDRVPSFSPSTYANGVAAATGNFYARLGKEPGPPHSCGTQSWYVGPYTDFGGDTSAIFPPGGYSTGVDIYLDVQYAQMHPDTRFDWSSQINDASGNFRRDFVFNVGADALGFVMTGGNNSTRCSANPADPNPGHAPVVHITQSGWYSFEHIFTGIAGGPLVVNMRITQKSTNVVMGTWTRADPTDIIGVTVGGNGDGWFVQNEFDGLAIDNTYRTGAMSTPLCTTNITGGGWIAATNMDRATFGGNAKVDSDSNASGQEEYQDHGPAQPITVNSIAVNSVYCTDDRTKATILGTATVNGSGMHEYQIDVTDNGQSGANDAYRIFIPDIGYDSGEHTLGGGNITIH